MGMPMKLVTAVMPADSPRAISPRFMLLREKREDMPDRKMNSPAKSGCRMSNTGFENIHLGAPKNTVRLYSRWWATISTTDSPRSASIMSIRLLFLFMRAFYL